MVYWFIRRRAVAQNDHNAEYSLGSMYEGGRGVEKNMEKAAELYLKSAEAGNVDAMFNLGWMYHKGQGVRKSWVQSAQWLQRASDQGHAESQVRGESNRKSVAARARTEPASELLSEVTHQTLIVLLKMNEYRRFNSTIWEECT